MKRGETFQYFVRGYILAMGNPSIDHTLQDPSEPPTEEDREKESNKQQVFILTPKAWRVSLPLYIPVQHI
jgi:hypothetical protein